MKFPSSSILGLAISDRDISVAQVSLAKGKRIVRRLAQFCYPAEASLQQPDALGKRFAAWLGEHGFSASRAVVGVPVKWLIAQEKELPPADEAQAIAMLRLQVERLSISESSEMTFDVATDGFDAAKPSRVLVVGMLKQQLDRVAAFCRSAGIEPLAITSTTLVLSRSLSGAEDRPTVVLSRHGAEIVWHARRGPRMMRHVAAAPTASTETLGGELRRALMLAPAGAGAGDSSGEVALFRNPALSPQDVRDLQDRLGRPVRTGYTLDTIRATADLKALNGAADQMTPDAFLPAVALAVTGGSRGACGVDLLHSRLTVEPPARFGRRTITGAALATLSVLLLVLLYLQILQTEADAQLLEDQLLEQKLDIAAAESRLERFNYGRGYFETRPPVLDALREVTLAFRPDEPIWVTNFTLRDNGKGQIQGKASDQRVVLAVLDRLRANPKFAEVLSQDMREAAGSSGQWAFTITFTLATREGMGRP